MNTGLEFRLSVSAPRGCLCVFIIISFHSPFRRVSCNDLVCFASPSTRNLSQGSSDTGYFGGSLEKEQRRKRKQLDEGRVDAEAVINELMEQAHLDKVVQGEESKHHSEIPGSLVSPATSVQVFMTGRPCVGYHKTRLKYNIGFLQNFLFFLAHVQESLSYGVK